MALEVHCSVPGCGLPMTMPGAVVMSPPMGYSTKRMQVTKYHICALCWATKFYKLLDDGEFENMRPTPTPLAVDEELKMIEPTSLGLKSLIFRKDQAIAEMDPEIDVMKILGRALWNRVEDDMATYFAGLEANQLVPNYTHDDAELCMLMHDQFWADRKKKHPIWDLIKRGWL